MWLSYWAGGDHIFTKENITKGINQSLKLLKTDYLDLVQLHNPIKNVVEENDVIQTLLDIKQDGKVSLSGPLQSYLLYLII
ncbi:MAG: hypothetical protein CM1200mP7_2590 [Chloroflexota bacterium]|nr:MAG: hypothetical protein CM1200mP7_2590 [Chloroflexota bacterium]